MSEVIASQLHWLQINDHHEKVFCDSSPSRYRDLNLKKKSRKSLNFRHVIIPTERASFFLYFWSAAGFHGAFNLTGKVVNFPE